jgi:hypothetical protein
MRHSTAHALFVIDTHLLLSQFHRLSEVLEGQLQVIGNEHGPQLAQDSCAHTDFFHVLSNTQGVLQERGCLAQLAGITLHRCQSTEAVHLQSPDQW